MIQNVGSLKESNFLTDEEVMSLLKTSAPHQTLKLTKSVSEPESFNSPRFISSDTRTKTRLIGSDSESNLDKMIFSDLSSTNDKLKIGRRQTLIDSTEPLGGVLSPEQLTEDIVAKE